MNTVTQSRSTKLFGWLGLLSIALFILSLVFIHSAGADVDWLRDYVSNMANEPLGWAFNVGAFIHGLGYLSIALGLYFSVCQGWLRSWGVKLLIVVTAGVFLVALFPTDPPDQVKTITGQVHRIAATIAFMSELAALFVFSTVFRHDCHWREFQTISLVISIVAALAVATFIIAIQVNIAPGLAERMAMVPLLVWEVWVCIRLIKRDKYKNP